MRADDPKRQRQLAGREALLLRSSTVAHNEVIERARRLARSSEPLHIDGESGTAKSSLARAIWEWSLRRVQPLETIVLSSIDDQLACSELFGHRKGAFTGAVENRMGLCRRADGGTLFLDEIAKSSPTLQNRLLELIEDRRIRPLGGDTSETVDCRIISASNTPLDEAVAKGQFLPDLQRRISFLRLRLLPLRERRADIPGIVAWMVEDRVQLEPILRRVPRLHPELLLALQAHSWPGNLRELAGVVAQLLLENPEVAELTPAHARELLITVPAAEAPITSRAMLRPSRPSNADLFAALARSSGNVTKAAKELGIHRTTLSTRLRGLEGLPAV